jgi:urea transport system permease protein
VLTGGLQVGTLTLSYNRLFIIAMAIFCLLAIILIINKTKLGLQMRAVTQNRAMAQCTGINSRRVDTITFGIGSGLAGIAGCSIALLGSIDATVGQSYIVNSFMAVVLGGVGDFIGTIFGSAIIGFGSIGIESFTSASIAKAIVLLLIIIFLQRKPQGLFSTKSRQLDE